METSNLHLSLDGAEDGNDHEDTCKSKVVLPSKGNHHGSNPNNDLPPPTMDRNIKIQIMHATMAQQTQVHQDS